MPQSLSATSRRHQGVRERPTAIAWLLAGLGALFARSSLPLSLPTTSERLVVELATAALAVAGVWWLANVLVLATALRRGRPLPTLQLPGARRVAQGLLVLTMTTSCVADDESPRMVYVGAVEATSDDTVSDELASDELASVSDDVVVQPSTTTVEPTTTRPTTTPSSSGAEPVGPPPPDDTENSATNTENSATNPENSATNSENSATNPESSLVGAAAATDIAEHQIVVRAGDNLWSLAEEALMAHGIDEPSCAEIADYWRSVLAANSVRSGDPNLIVPGEAITMPAYRIDDAADAASGAPMESAPAAAGSGPYGFHHR